MTKKEKKLIDKEIDQQLIRLKNYLFNLYKKESESVFESEFIKHLLAKQNEYKNN